MQASSGSDRFDLARMRAADLVLCGAAVARAASARTTLASAAEAVVRHLHDHLWDADANRRATVLVRFYRTHALGELDPDQRRLATAALDREPWDSMKCLVLTATAGLEPRWNSVAHSAGHRVIPLPSARAVARLPMVAALMEELGVAVAEVGGMGSGAVRPASAGARAAIFHVPEARGSRHIPAQRDFVEPYGVRSVVGFGGSLRSGDFWTVILFSRVPVGGEVARGFRFISADIKMAILPVLAPVLPTGG